MTFNKRNTNKTLFSRPQSTTMEVWTSECLQQKNTFGVPCTALAYAPIRAKEQLDVVGRVFEPREVFILGGGSNVLFRSAPHRLVLHNQLSGYRIDKEEENTVIVAAAGGENWHKFVRWTLEQGFGGLENLSLIPGSVGAAPIQNIGAYGVDLSQVIYDLEAYDIVRGEWRRFQPEECGFGYRDSYFKQAGKGRYFVTEVRFRLSVLQHVLNTSYGAIEEELHRRGISNPDPEDVSQAVMAIRRSKLPDPLALGNAGSFFKNPIIKRALFSRLRKAFPDMVHYPGSPKYVKISAGWLIEQCGWRGQRQGWVGSYPRQSLVLVNYGQATGHDIWSFAQAIKQSVREKFGITLEEEVNVVGDLT